MDNRLKYCKVIQTEIENHFKIKEESNSIINFLDVYFKQINLHKLENITIHSIILNENEFGFVISLNKHIVLKFNFVKNDKFSLNLISLSSYLMESLFKDCFVFDKIGYIDINSNFLQSTNIINKLLNMNNKQLEKLVALPNVVVDNHLKDGISPLKDSTILDDNICLLPRYLLEESNDFRHLVSYIIVKDESGNILSYSRTKNAGESRLHGKYSIGIGGHVNSDDYEVALHDKSHYDQLSLVNICSNGRWREIYEEIGLSKKRIGESNGICNFKRFIVTNDNPVDKVHIGCVYEITIPNEIISNINLEDKYTNLEWLSINELKKNIESYENWSKILINEL